MGTMVYDHNLCVLAHVVANPLLLRKQMKFVMNHEGIECPSAAAMCDIIAKKMKVPSALVAVAKQQSKYGGGVSSGLAYVYDSTEAMTRFASKKTCIRKGLLEKQKRPSCRTRKELKNRLKKFRGTAKAALTKRK